MNVLGLHVFDHDTGVALFVDGKLEFCQETERLTRVKNDINIGATLAYLATAFPGVINELDYVAMSIVDHDLSAYDGWLEPDVVLEALRAFRDGQLAYEASCRLLGKVVPCLLVMHEASHAALACHTAGYADPCTALINEGDGTFSACSLFEFRDGKLTLLDMDMLPWYASGFAWQNLSSGVLKLGEPLTSPGKAMALAAFGQVSAEYRELILGVDGAKIKSLAEQRDVIERTKRRVEQGVWLDEAGDLVRTFQQLFMEAVAGLLSTRMRHVGNHTIAMAGGCALNVVANQFLRAQLATDIAIPPACNDSGQALGSAIYALRFCLGVTPGRFSVYSNGHALSLDNPQRSSIEHRLTLSDFSPQDVARALANDAVVAYADGKSELGPRALGHRSLLANPQTPGMKRRVSEQIKQREWYRPLAPVMRYERFKEMFPSQPASPHMLFSYDVPGDPFPEATHVDKTARIQTVRKDDNPRLYAILEEFESLTGVCALINTSLNARGKPIAHSAADVLDDFVNKDVDLFVLGDVVGERVATRSGH